MGFVKSAEEIGRIEAALSRPRYFDAARLTVEFLTEPELLRALLPPPLEPAERPLVAVTVGRWRSNCAGDFDGATVHLSARHGELEGGYALAMYMSGEGAVAFGREVVGEPKKLGRGALFSGEGRHHAWLERGGTRLIELQMEESAALGPQRTTSVTFNYKARTAAAGRGLEEDPILTATSFENSIHDLREGTATLRLRSTALDPLAELPVAEVVRGLYATYEAEASCEAVARVPAAAFAPFHYGRLDDPTAA